jgi:hypothetical protein
MQDLKQLWKDCFCHIPVVEMSAVELDSHEINEHNSHPVNDRRDSSQKGDIFERMGDRMTGHEYIGPLDSRLREDVVSGPNSPPKEDAAVPRDECNQSNESSETARKAGDDSDLPVSVHNLPKNFLQRWKAKRAAAAREKATMRRRREQCALRPNVAPTYPEILAAAGIIP